MNTWSTKQAIKKVINKFTFMQRPWWKPKSSSLIINTQDKFSGTYHEVYGETSNKLGLPNFVGTTTFSFMAEPIDNFASIGVYKLENATVCCSFGVVMDAANNIITQTSWNRVSPHYIRLPTPPEHLKTIHLTGLTAVIATDSSNGNYGHFLLDSIGRLAIFEKILPNVAKEIDHIIVSEPEKGWKIRLLSNYGISPDKIVWINDNTKYRCDCLIASSFPGAMRTYPSWLPDFLKQSVFDQNNTEQNNAVNKKRRLFFVRKGTSRRLKNEVVLFALAKRYGFEWYVPEEAKDSLQDFKQSEAVIAPHGAGLADIALMSEGSKVIELMPSDHRHCYFFTLAKAAFLDYTVIVGKSDGERGDDAWGPSPFDFEINESDLNAVLESVYPS
jgi:hypothetical protein